MHDSRVTLNPSQREGFNTALNSSNAYNEPESPSFNFLLEPSLGRSYFKGALHLTDVQYFKFTINLEIA